MKYRFGSDIIYAISISHYHCISLIVEHGSTMFLDILQYNGICMFLDMYHWYLHGAFWNGNVKGRKKTLVLCASLFIFTYIKTCVWYYQNTFLIYYVVLQTILMPYISDYSTFYYSYFFMYESNRNLSNSMWVIWNLKNLFRHLLSACYLCLSQPSELPI